MTSQCYLGCVSVPMFVRGGGGGGGGVGDKSVLPGVCQCTHVL